MLRESLERIRNAGKKALQRTRLAIGGREVMETLEIAPGPLVGRALRHLTRCVEEDPRCNDEDELRGLLRAWAKLHS